MPKGLHERGSHTARRTKNTIITCVLHHIDDGPHTAAGLTKLPGPGIVVFNFGGRVRPVAELVLQPHDLYPVARAIRTPARDQETGQPIIRIGQRQERIAHRRGAKPFVAGQEVGAVAVRNGPCRVRAHVGTALLFRHGHANRDAALLVSWNHPGIIAAGLDAGHPDVSQVAVCRQSCNAGIGHRHRAGYAGISLPHQDHHDPMGYMAGFRLCPGIRRDAGIKSKLHQLVIGRMKFDLVETAAKTVKCSQLRHMPIGLTRQRLHVSRSAFCTKVR